MTSKEQSDKHSKPAEIDAWLKQLKLSETAQQRVMLNELVCNAIRNILGLAASSDIPSDIPLTEQGFDSLMAVQLTNGLGRSLGQRLPVSSVFNYPTTQSLVGFLATLFEDASAQSGTKPDQLSRVADDAQSLLDDLDKLLGPNV
jgi:acyl carrier protein